MTEPDLKPVPWYSKLPPRLAAVVVFLVALTTLLGNVLDLRRESAAIATPAVAPAPPDAQALPHDAPVPVAILSDRLELGLERLIVRHDGTVGTTDWRFTVEVEGEPVLAFAVDDLDDSGGRNVATPEGIDAMLRVPPGTRVPLVVKAWRSSRFRAAGREPDAIGEGEILADDAIAPITVVAPRASNGEFVLRFSTRRHDGPVDRG